jgi:hypothetical protein
VASCSWRCAPIAFGEAKKEIDKLAKSHWKLDLLVSFVSLVVPLCLPRHALTERLSGT